MTTTITPDHDDLILRYDDVHAALTDHATFCSDRTTAFMGTCPKGTVNGSPLSPPSAA